MVLSHTFFFPFALGRISACITQEIYGYICLPYFICVHSKSSSGGGKDQTCHELYSEFYIGFYACMKSIACIMILLVCMCFVDNAPALLKGLGAEILLQIILGEEWDGQGSLG